MSFTSNSWKQSGARNRTKTNQNIKANQMAPSNLNITEKIGVENSITPLISNLESSTSSFLYNFQNGKNFNNNIAYYPFNKEINTIGISNESLNPLLYTPSNFDLNYQGSGNYLSLVSSPFNQSATQFSENAKTLISNFSYNTQNVFGIDPGNSISYAITAASYIYVSSDASNFCFFGMDNFNQDALTNNGNISTGISNESFYLWYPDNDGKATIYYTTINSASGKTYGFSTQSDIVLKDQWHSLSLTLNGQYVYINQNGKTVFNEPVSVGTKVPDQPIAINLSSKSYDSNTKTVITNGSTNSGIIQLLDYNITNYSSDPATVSQIKEFRDRIETVNNSNLPNRKTFLNYAIGENINYLTSKIIAGNGIGNNGSLTNYGEFNNFSIANFFDTTTFYGNVQFDSSTSLVYDSSLNSSLEIYTLQGKAGHVTSSFLIENAGAVPGNSFNPTMVVYNGTSAQINTPLPTQGLVFSISGENVSVGDIFGSHTFDVSGSSYLHGNLTINDTQNGGYGSYPTSINGIGAGSIVLRNAFSDGNGNGSTGIVFRGPTNHGNDYGAIGYIDNIGTTTQSLPASTIPASYNYYGLSGSENSCLYMSVKNDVAGFNADSLVLRSSGYFILDTGNYTMASSSDYPNSTNRQSGGPISILPNGGSVGIGKLNPTTGYVLDVSGNTNITGSLELTGNKINITNSTPNSSIAIGASAGNSNQSANSIAIGYNAGQTSLGQNSIAIGQNTVNQYTTSVALGAGATTTANNQIVLGTVNETVTIPGGLNEPNVNGRLYIKSYNNSDYGTAYSNLDGSANTFMSFYDYNEQTFSRLRYNIQHLASGVTRGLEYQAGDNWNEDPYSFRITHYDSTSGTQAWPFFMIDGTRENNQINGNLFINTGEFGSESSLSSTNNGLTIQSIESNYTTAITNAYIYGNGQAFFSSKVGIGTDTPNYTLDVSGNTNITGTLSANNVGPLSDNRLLPNVASQWIQSAGSISQLNMNGYMFTRAILNYNETNTTPTGLIFGTGANTNQSDYLSLVTNGLTRLLILPGGTVGINTTNPNNSYILDVNGNINVNGSITSTGSCSCSSYNTTSDLRLKENISDLDNSLEKICNIRGVSYNLKSDENKTKISGVIAQEVMEHIPEAVNNMDSEKLSVNYNSIIAHLIESVKELKREIEELKSKN